MKSLSNYTQPLIEEYLKKNNYVETKIILNWYKIIDDYNEITFPHKVSFIKNKRNDGLLILNVKKGFGIEVQMKIPTILDKINNYLGYKAISKIKLRQVNF